MGMIELVKVRRDIMVPPIPLIVVRRQHSIICVFLNYNASCDLCISRIRACKLSVRSEDISQPLTTQWRLSVDRSNRRSQFGVNDNVFCVGHISKL